MADANESTVELSTDAGIVQIPADVTPPEAAAIAAAVGAHIRDQYAAALAATASDDEDSWEGKRWQFTGRVERLSGVRRRPPRNLPNDEWTASGRRDRY